MYEKIVCMQFHISLDISEHLKRSLLSFKFGFCIFFTNYYINVDESLACQKSPILSFQTVIMYVLEKREQMKKSVIFLPRWSKAVHHELNGKIIQERPRCKYTDSKARLS